MRSSRQPCSGSHPNSRSSFNGEGTFDYTRSVAPCSALVAAEESSEVTYLCHRNFPAFVGDRGARFTVPGVIARDGGTRSSATPRARVQRYHSNVSGTYRHRLLSSGAPVTCRVTLFNNRSPHLPQTALPTPENAPNRPRIDPEPALGTPLPTLSAALPIAQETPPGPTPEQPPTRKTPRIQGTFAASLHPRHPDPKTTSAPLLTSGADLCTLYKLPIRAVSRSWFSLRARAKAARAKAARAKAARAKAARAKAARAKAARAKAARGAEARVRERAKRTSEVWSLLGPPRCLLAIVSVGSSPAQLRHRTVDGSAGALQSASLREYPMCSSGDATRELGRLSGCQLSLPRGIRATAETEKRGQAAHGRGAAVHRRPRMLCSRILMRGWAASQEPSLLKTESHEITVPGLSCS